MFIFCFPRSRSGEHFKGKEGHTLKKRGILLGAGLLAAGLFLGTLCPPGILPWSPKQDPQVNRVFSNLTVTDAANFAVSGQDSSYAPAQFNIKDNFFLLDSACSAALAMQQRDWDALSSFVHPELGVTFTPYSTVEPNVDLNFSAKQIKKLAEDDTPYVWGMTDGKGDPIQMTMLDYFERYVYNVDYCQAPQIGIDRIMVSGNALENITDAYPDCRFVDFCYPSIDPAYGGADWCSLKLVFQALDGHWYLVGVVHGEWTV